MERVRRQGAEGPTHGPHHHIAAASCVLDASFDTCDLSEADWEKSHQTHVEVRASRLLGLKAVEARLQDMTVVGCDASFALFFGAILVATRFAGRIVTEAFFQEADLTGVVFDRCGLRGGRPPRDARRRRPARGARTGCRPGRRTCGGPSWTRHKPRFSRVCAGSKRPPGRASGAAVHRAARRGCRLQAPGGRHADMNTAVVHAFLSVSREVVHQLQQEQDRAVKAKA